jgi:hypothetical protein
MPDSFQILPGQDAPADLSKKLDFIAFHETGHLFQHATQFVSPDLFLEEFYATMLATAYALHARPLPATKPRFTSRKGRSNTHLNERNFRNFM